MNANLFDRVELSIADPTRTAIMSRAGEPVTYAELVAWAGRLANVLVACGVKPGDRVAVQVEKSIPAIVLYLATLQAGAVYLPLNTAYTLAELEYFIGDAEPTLVVCDPARREGHQSDRREDRRLRRDAGRKRPGDAGRSRRPATGDLRDGAKGGRRSGRDPLHLGHHRPLERRDADAR